MIADEVNSDVSTDTRAFVLERAGYRCERCKIVAPREHRLWCGLDLHHIVEQQDGGSGLPENLMVLCIECHQGWRTVKATGIAFDSWMAAAPDRSAALPAYVQRGQPRVTEPPYPVKFNGYDTEVGVQLWKAIARKRLCTTGAAMRQVCREEARRLGIPVTEEDDV